MIGIDTNVLLRNATQDDPVQSPQARAFMDGLSVDDPGFISVVTIVETAWTLRTRYNADIDAIGGLISALVGAQELVVQEADIVRRVARESVTHHVDFVDLLIAHLGIAHGCDYTVTFDRKASRLPGMKLLEA
ncbi:MAG: type II toxin-antitoxin system VapC family toxin [Rhodoglobus sp.]|nr:type II toxin-antitoxin system VapC family toxin [Rhodoglobus sp.]